MCQFLNTIFKNLKLKKLLCFFLMKIYYVIDVTSLEIVLYNNNKYLSPKVTTSEFEFGN